MPDPVKSDIPFRADIQGVRAIAVLLVALAHAGLPGFSGGFIGVDIFFVISGYLITGILIQERARDGRIRYGRFLARRLRRLLPAMLVMLLVVQLSASFLLSSYEALMQTGSLVYAATWTSNLYFALSELDYFANLQDKDLYLHTWSLGVEEQFYLLWPWLVMFAMGVATTRGRPEPALNVLRYSLLAIFLASFMLSIYWTQRDALLAFYMMPSRSWQFALGAGAYLAAGSSPQFVTAVRNKCQVLALLLIAGGTLFLHDEMVYPGYYALIPSVATALLLFGGAGAQTSPVTALLSSRPAVWLGDRSYSIYLWHWPVLMLGGAYGLADSYPGVTAMLFATLAAAGLSYSLVEKPFWKGRYSKGSPRTVALSSTLTLVMVVGVAHSMVADIFTGIPASNYEYSDEIWAGGNTAFAPPLHCDGWHFNADVVPCVAGDANAPRTAVLIGDSQGANWASFLPEIYSAPQWRVLLFTKSACAIADVDYFYQPAGGLYDVCSEWRDAVLLHLAGLQPDIVFVSSSAYYEFSESQWIEGARSVVERLVAVTDNVVLIPGTPKLSFDGPSCIREPSRFTLRLQGGKRMCQEEQESTTSDLVASYFERVAASFPDAHVLNINDLVCPGRRCAARNAEGIAVYSDDLHLTNAFVVSNTSRIKQRMDALLVQDAEGRDRLTVQP